jgi:hypothetical protein
MERGPGCREDAVYVGANLVIALQKGKHKVHPYDNSQIQRLFANKYGGITECPMDGSGK